MPTLIMERNEQQKKDSKTQHMHSHTFITFMKPNRTKPGCTFSFWKMLLLHGAMLTEAP